LLEDGRLVGERREGEHLGFLVSGQLPVANDTQALISNQV